jgi:hypothetical protein
VIPNPIERCIQAFSNLLGREQGVVFTPIACRYNWFRNRGHVCNQLPDEISTVRIVELWAAGRNSSRQKRQARIYLFLPSPARRIHGVPETVPDRSRKISVAGHGSFWGRFIVTSSVASAIEPGHFFAGSNNFSVEISGSG